MMNLIFSKFLSYNLKKEGFIVFTAANGKDALETAKKEVS